MRLCLCVALVRGSSPRVRGKHEDLIKETAKRGLIPACAGKTLAYR